MAAKETVIESVKMGDGRVVEFAGKRKLLKESFVDTSDNSVKIRLDFRNGETRLFTVPPASLLKFAAHGAEQKLGDEIAGVDDIDDCVIGIDELIDRLYNGEWGQRREVNSLAGTSVLVRAMVEVYGKSVEKIKTFLKDKTHAEKVALRGSDKLKATIARIEAEKVTKTTSKVDTEALLAGLDDGAAGE